MPSTLALRDNLEFLEEQYARFQENPAAVETSWRHFFEGVAFGASQEENPLSPRVAKLIEAYRKFGHLGAHVNPLAPAPELPGILSPAAFDLEEAHLGQSVQPVGFQGGAKLTPRQIIARLQECYCGPIGFEFVEGLDAEAAEWLVERIEAGRPPFSREQRLRILDRLAAAEGFERFLQTRFLGKKRFSVEGLESLIPVLDALVTAAGEGGTEEITLGMAHRGRLNVLANILQKPLAKIMMEFEESEFSIFDIEGDVKYHMGFSSTVQTPRGKSVRLYLSPNPSHLEFVCPVVEGYVFSRQQMLADTHKSRVIPVLLHGDASFVGQGIVSETLNLAGLAAYATGGTIHVVTNNQVGFTTDPRDSRSTLYASSVAKQLGAPVFHVNADEPEAAVFAIELALSFRMKFGRDVVVDLIGYRRFGHNEGDEPAFTQPLLCKKILAQPSVLAWYVASLEGVASGQELTEPSERVKRELEQAYTVAHATEKLTSRAHVAPLRSEVMQATETGVPVGELKEVLKALTHVPPGWNAHPKLKRILEQRSHMLDAEGAVDWSVGELFALATLACEGHVVRLSGQDCKRGTFSSRHAVLFDSENGSEYQFLKNISPMQASISVVNSPLSEAACLGFEFGYSVANRDALVLWEAQFGDFANGAQVIIDQFLAASEAKWGQTSGLCLLLPHGYEGMGPEHSSARLERFLQLCGNFNIQVCNVTTPAQLFHVLRRQLKRRFRKPLVMMTPKSLLRHPDVISKTAEFEMERFSEILVDEVTPEPLRVERFLCCSGKIAYDLMAAKREAGLSHIPILRFEQLYPFPLEAFRELLDRYSNVREVVWVQEEPKNMGAWNFWRSMVEDTGENDRPLRILYAGRKAAGTTAEGYSKAHQSEQQRILREALGIASGWKSLRSFVAEEAPEE